MVSFGIFCAFSLERIAWIKVISRLKSTLADLSLRLDIPMFWSPFHQPCLPTPSCLFPVPSRREVGVDVQTRHDISRTVEDRG